MRAHQSGERLHQAELVAEALEPVPGLLGVLQRLGQVALPQPEVGEQGLHHGRCPVVAAISGLGPHHVGQVLGLDDLVELGGEDLVGRLVAAVGARALLRLFLALAGVERVVGGVLVVHVGEVGHLTLGVLGRLLGGLGPVAAFRRLIRIAFVALVITSLEGWLITPPLMGKAAKMNAITVFVGLLVWSWIWGVWGTILAVPMLAALKACCDHIAGLRPVGRLMGD